MDPRTHLGIDRRLCGEPVRVSEGFGAVRLVTTRDMAADDRGLVHGGFVFGAADHAAMLAVNDPNVVLGSAQVKFLKPVKVGEELLAEGRVLDHAGRRHEIDVTVLRGDTEVFKGTFTCFVLDRHPLDR